MGIRSRFSLTKLTIRSLLLLIICSVALPAAGIILYTGIQARNVKLDEARKETLKLTDTLVTEQHNLVVGAEQLMATLAMLPEVKNANTAKVEPLLRELHKLNPIYSNIFIANKEGTVWATAVPVKAPFVIADRRYFRNALASGQLSSGEYIVSRANTRPIISLSYPVKDQYGAVNGVISIGFLIDRYRELLQRMQLPAGTSFVLVDHRGIVLSRAINPERFIGKPYPGGSFQQMQDGPDTGTRIRTGIAGDTRIISYRKLRLPGELTPYMYLTAGIPIEVITGAANRALRYNMALLISFLVLASLGALLLGKRSIADRIRLLEDASQALAAGDLQVRVSELVVGGELGNLGRIFDAMAEQLAQREAERLQAEEERLILERQFLHAQKMESLGILAGGIAHDFNNILAIIIGYCSLVRLDCQSADSCIPEIEKAADRAAALCRQMLAYAGKAQFIQSQFQVEALVDETIKMLTSTISQNVCITFGFTGTISSIKGDASQIGQVVMNLIINSAESIGEGHGEVRISLSKVQVKADQSAKDCHGKTIPPGSYVCLDVTDNGSGMNDDTKLRIFEPFYTTKFTGRGLGMSAVLGIINGHGGAIQLFSRLGEGTTFKVYLPITAGHADQSDSLQQTIPSAPLQEMGTILLVEDDAVVMHVAKTMLESLGFPVMEACNGREALELYRMNSADITLVVTDMDMPVMDGFELFAALKRLQPGLPIVISSGFGDSVVTSRIPSAQIAGLVCKPYAVEKFQEVLGRIVRLAGLPGERSG